jgi:hypothetical protein
MLILRLKQPKIYSSYLNKLREKIKSKYDLEVLYETLDFVTYKGLWWLKVKSTFSHKSWWISFESASIVGRNPLWFILSKR